MEKIPFDRDFFHIYFHVLVIILYFNGCLTKAKAVISSCQNCENRLAWEWDAVIR